MTISSISTCPYLQQLKRFNNRLVSKTSSFLRWRCRRMFHSRTWRRRRGTTWTRSWRSCRWPWRGEVGLEGGMSQRIQASQTTSSTSSKHIALSLSSWLWDFLISIFLLEFWSYNCHRDHHLLCLSFADLARRAVVVWKGWASQNFSSFFNCIFSQLPPCIAKTFLERF